MKLSGCNNLSGRNHILPYCGSNSKCLNGTTVNFRRLIGKQTWKNVFENRISKIMLKELFLKILRFFILLRDYFKDSRYAKHFPIIKIPISKNVL